MMITTPVTEIEMRRPVALAMSAILVMPLGGCGTFMNFLPMPHGGGGGIGEVRVYGGVRIDVEAVFPPEESRKSEREFSWWMIPLIPVAFALWVTDLSLCLVMDTLALPITIPAAVGRDSKQPQPQRP